MTISLLDDAKLAVLRTDSAAYVLGWRQPDTTAVRHLYWGPPITDQDASVLAAIDPTTRQPSSTATVPRAAHEEYPSAGRLRREELALKLTMPDGVRSIDLAVTDVSLSSTVLPDDCLTITLTDTHYPVRVRLRYQVCGDALVRSAEIINSGSDPITVEQAASASFAVPVGPHPQALTLTGMYGAESRITTNPLPRGRFTLESRSGIPGHDALPFVAIDGNGTATETDGEVWSVALAWSGSWKITTQRSDDDLVHIVGGVNDFDLRHRLPGGATLALPPLVGVFAPDGWGGLTSRWHTYQRTVLPRASEPRPVHYNSWEAAYFTVSHQQQIALARTAAELGVELFVIDDGWFAGRHSDTAGLGDWQPDPTKFPGNTLAELADHVHGLGMQFGLWVEPEMVNQDSDLFRAHPDWIYRWPTREPTVARHQLMLDFSRRDVQDWAIATLDELVTRYRLDYLKWDMNRPLAEPDSESVADGGSVWIEHVLGLYRVWDTLRDKHSGLWIESCASGGGRADLGAIARTHWTWPSDNTDPIERLEIQRGYSLLNLPMTMASWVTDRPALGKRDTPLQFRFHVAMTGLLSIGGNIAQWSDADRKAAAGWIETYQQIRPLVQFGRLHRLDSPAPGETEAMLYVDDNADTAVLFVFARIVLHTRIRQRIRLRGLDRATCYRVVNTVTGDETTCSGALLAGHGVLIPLAGAYDSTILLLTRI